MGGSIAAPSIKTAKKKTETDKASLTDISPEGIWRDEVLGFSASIFLSTIRFTAFAKFLAPKKAVMIQIKLINPGIPREAKKDAATAKDAENIECENITREL